MTTTTPAASPAAIYLANLSPGSRQGMRQALDAIAGILDVTETFRIRLGGREVLRPPSGA